MRHFKMGERVMIDPANDNEGYATFRHIPLVIMKVSRSKEDHPGYDEGLEGSYLYDLRTITYKDVPFSLYDGELVPHSI